MKLSMKPDYFNRLAISVSKIAAGLAAVILFLMMLLTGSDVVLRYFFDNPIPGALEITEFMMAVLVSFGLAICAVQKRHVRIELLIMKLPDRIQSVLNLISNLAFLLLFLIIVWRTAVRAISIYNEQLTSPVLFIPKYPFFILLIVGCSILCLVILKDIVNFLFKVQTK